MYFKDKIYNVDWYEFKERWNLDINLHLSFFKHDTRKEASTYNTTFMLHNKNNT